MVRNRWQPLTLTQWFNTEEYKKGQSLSPKEFVEVWFNRMPIRVAYQKPNWIFAPFDGIITHIGKYKPDKDVFDVKGQGYTINQVLETEMDCECYACAIFLTAFSVHLGRFPVRGTITALYELPAIVTDNISMIDAEYDLFNKKINPTNLKFVYKNQRKVLEIYNHENDIDVIIVSIADREVDSILDFKKENDFCIQGERMQFVCWGSYALLVIPLNRNKNLKLKPLVEPFHYVYAGQTVIFEIGDKK